jgi:hypothetical protein
MQGQLIQEINVRSEGSEALITWDLTNRTGNLVPNGMYFIKTSTGYLGKVIIQK